MRPVRCFNQYLCLWSILIVKEIHVCLFNGYQEFIKIGRGDALTNMGYDKPSCRVLRKMGTNHILLHIA